MVGATLGIAILGAIFAHFAGQAAAPDRFLEGFRVALSLGGAVQLAGAVAILHFLPRESALALEAIATKGSSR